MAHMEKQSHQQEDLNLIKVVRFDVSMAINVKGVSHACSEHESS